MKSFCENKIKISAVLTNEVFYIILFQYGDEIDFIVKKKHFPYYQNDFKIFFL